MLLVPILTLQFKLRILSITFQVINDHRQQILFFTSTKFRRLGSIPNLNTYLSAEFSFDFAGSRHSFHASWFFSTLKHIFSQQEFIFWEVALCRSFEAVCFGQHQLLMVVHVSPCGINCIHVITNDISDGFFEVIGNFIHAMEVSFTQWLPQLFPFVFANVHVIMRDGSLTKAKS